MTSRQDFTIDAGRDYGLSVALFEEDSETPLNLLDCELEWVVTKAAGAHVLVLKSSIDPAEIEINDMGGGLITIYVHQADTDALGALTLEHELMVTNAAGSEATLMRGLITILKSVIH